MSNLIIPKQDPVFNKLSYDEKQTKQFVEEIERYGYIMKLDDTIPLNADKQKQFGRFKVCMDTKYKIYEIFIWED